MYEASLNLHHLTNKVKDINRRLTLSNELKINYKKKWDDQAVLTQKQNDLITNLKQQLQELQDKGKQAEHRIRELSLQHKASVTKIQNKYTNEETITRSLQNIIDNQTVKINELQATIIHLQNQLTASMKQLNQTKDEYTIEQAHIQRNIVDLVTQKITQEERKLFLEEENSLLKSSNTILLEDKRTLQMQIISVQHELQNTIQEIRQKLDVPYSPYRTIVYDEKLYSPLKKNVNNTVITELIEPSSTTSTVSDASVQTTEPLSTSSSLPLTHESHESPLSTTSLVPPQPHQSTVVVPHSRSHYHQYAHEKVSEKRTSTPTVPKPSSWSRTPRFFPPFQETMNNSTTVTLTTPTEVVKKGNNSIHLDRSLVRKNKPAATALSVVRKKTL